MPTYVAGPHHHNENTDRKELGQLTHEALCSISKA